MPLSNNFFEISKLKTHWPDTLGFITILFLCLLVFGLNSDQLGFYADDAGFLIGAPDLNWSNLFHNMLLYVTGRNLHILWQFGIYEIFGYSLEDLGSHHWLQAFFSGLNASLVYIALRLFDYRHLVAFLASMIFAFYPNHPEVQYWLSSLPMNLMSTFFVLMLLISAILYFNSIKLQKEKSTNFLLVLCFLFYICALFTYDQTVPVVVTMAVVIGLVGLWNKSSRTSAFIYTFLVCAIFIGLFIWKIRDPAGGPVLSNVNVQHMWYTFNLSIEVMLGIHLQNLLQSLLPHANMNQKMFAFSAIVVIGLFGIIINERLPIQKVQKNKLERVSNSFLNFFQPFMKPLLRIVFPVVFYLLAYLPVYIWYIAPRHNYLPTVSIAFGVAFLFSTLIWLLNTIFRRQLNLVNSLLLIGLSTLILYPFIKADLVQKEAWITSYQARKYFYAELTQRGLLKNGFTLVLGGFPVVTPYGSAPLGYAPPTEVQLFTKGKIRIENLDKTIQPSASGVYVLSLANEFGLNAFRHAPWNEALVLRYKDLVGHKIDYEIVDSAAIKPNYLVRNIKTPIDSKDTKFSAIVENGLLNISIPRIQIAQGEVITLLPFSQIENKKTTLSFLNDYNVPLSFLIEVPEGAQGKIFQLILPKNMPLVSEIELYVSNAHQASRLIYETQVKYPSK